MLTVQQNDCVKGKKYLVKPVPGNQIGTSIKIITTTVKYPPPPKKKNHLEDLARKKSCRGRGREKNSCKLKTYHP